MKYLGKGLSLLAWPHGDDITPQSNSVHATKNQRIPMSHTRTCSQRHNLTGPFLPTEPLSPGTGKLQLQWAPHSCPSPQLSKQPQGCGRAASCCLLSLLSAYPHASLVAAQCRAGCVLRGCVQRSQAPPRGGRNQALLCPMVISFAM